MSEEQGGLAETVSRMYWESDASVGEIAGRLGLSRRALYDALAPAAANGECAACGGALVFTNRSNRSDRKAECSACGTQTELAALRHATAEAGAAMRREAERREAAPASRLGDEAAAEQMDRAGPMAPVDAAAAARRGRVLLLGGAALAGLALGVLAVRVARR